MLKLVSNKIRCKFCGDVIQSMSVHDFRRCRCGKCSTDGGLEYAQRSFFTENPEDTYEDLSTYIDENGKIVEAKEADAKDIPLKPIWIEIKKVPNEEPATPSSSPASDIPEVTEAVEAEPELVPEIKIDSGEPERKAEIVDSEEVVIDRDKEGKPISGRYPYGKQRK